LFFKQLFKPKWQHHDKAVRSRAIEKIRDNEEGLTAILQSDVDLETVREALDAISKQSILENLLFIDMGAVRRKDPGRFEQIQTMLFDRITESFFFLSGFQSSNYRHETRLRFFKQAITMGPLPPNIFKYSFFYPENHGKFTVDIANLITRDSDIWEFMINIHPLKYQNHFDAYCIALPKVSDFLMKIKLMRTILVKKEGSEYYLIPKILKDQLPSLEENLKKEVFKIIDATEDQFVALIAGIASDSPYDNYDHLLIDLYCSRLDASQLRRLLLDKQFYESRFADRAIEELDRKTRISDLDLLSYITEINNGSHHLRCGINTVILQRFFQETLTDSIVDVVKQSPFLMENNKFWEGLSSAAIMKHNLKDNLILFLDGTSWGKEEVFQEKAKALAICFADETIYSDCRCDACNGLGETSQHTDVGFGTQRCYHCSGTGMTTTSRTVLRVVQ